MKYRQKRRSKANYSVVAKNIKAVAYDAAGISPFRESWSLPIIINSRKCCMSTFLTLDFLF